VWLADRLSAVTAALADAAELHGWTPQTVDDALEALLITTTAALDSPYPGAQEVLASVRSALEALRHPPETPAPAEALAPVPAPAAVPVCRRGLSPAWRDRPRTWRGGSGLFPAWRDRAARLRQWPEAASGTPNGCPASGAASPRGRPAPRGGPVPGATQVKQWRPSECFTRR
jgi:hypothetical protein